MPTFCFYEPGQTEQFSAVAEAFTREGDAVTFTGVTHYRGDEMAVSVLGVIVVGKVELVEE
jgi:hypothetical protein